MGKKIRVLHVAQAAGGVERYLKCLMKYLDKNRYESILVCSYDYKEEMFRGIVDIFEQMEMQRTIGLKDFIAVIAVRQLIKKYRPDIVYAHSSKAGAIVRMANIGFRNKCIYNPHGWAFNMRNSRKKQFIYTLMEKIMAPLCDKIICISDAEKQSALVKRICSEDKLQVIFNGVDVEAYDLYEHNCVSRGDLKIPDDAFVVGMVGRLCLQKAPDVFIRMARKVKDKLPNAYFILVGNGEMQTEVMQYAEENELAEYLHITGWVSNPLSYVELFDVAVLLSRWEGFGLAIPEYMMAKKPVVATAVDAIPNIILDHINGLLVPIDDAEAASIAVLELQHNLDLRNMLIVQGTKDVREKYDARRVSKQQGEIFDVVLLNNL